LVLAKDVGYNAGKGLLVGVWGVDVSGRRGRRGRRGALGTGC